MGGVAVPKTVQKSPFVTPGCPWSTCGPTLRAEDRLVHRKGTILRSVR